jgi:hypothetical protein
MYEYQKTMEFKTRFISHEDRRIARQALTGKHGFKTQVKLGDSKLEASLSDFSSLGFAITLPQQHAAHFSVGQAIDIVVSPLIDHFYPIKGMVIDCQPVKMGEVKISAVIEHEQSCKHGKFQPIHLTPEQSLKGQIVHPFIYKQTTYFELESLSRNGFYATNINSDFTLFDGMEVHFSLGSVEGLQDVKGKVSNVGLTSDNHIRCFVETPFLSRSSVEQLAQHCFHFAQKTPRDIKLAGLASESIQELVQYRFVETQAEYEAVLKLRRKAYTGRGMAKKDDPIAKFALEQDAYGRILIVFHNARVIASALLVCDRSEQQPFELESNLPAQQFVQSLPPSEELMEITAIFIEKYYQETNVLHGVFESMYREGLSAGKNYVVVGSEPELVERYVRMGFQDSSLRYEHPRNCGLDMRVMVLNKETGKTGRGMSPILWWQVWGHVSVHLYQRRIIEYSVLQKCRVQFNRSLYQLVAGLKRFGQFMGG